MKYLLVVGFACDIYRQEPRARIFIRDKLIDEFYILPHKDVYPLFNLIMLSTSSLDGITVEQRDGIYKFFSDVAGTFIDIPKFRWHWVNPVREKTRYTAVFGLNPITNYDAILDQ